VPFSLDLLSVWGKSLTWFKGIVSWKFAMLSLVPLES
jgi:hypothetical protein